MEYDIKIYTDGGCSGNPGPGGWAFIINACGKKIKNSGYSVNTTNNRMELTAVIEALKALMVIGEYCNVEGVEIFTDSQYVKNGITSWIKKWEENGWKNSKKESVKNIDLWKSLRELSRFFRIDWRWVHGHSGDSLNEECDKMVKNEIKKVKNFSN